MNKSLRYLAAAGLIGGGCWLTSVWGQQTKPVRGQDGNPESSGDLVPPGIVYPTESQFKRPMESPSLPNPPSRPSLGPVGPDAELGPIDLEYYGPAPLMRRPWGMGGMNGGRREASEEMQAFKQAVDKLRMAKEGSDKDAAKKELAELLDRSFTHDLERREQEVAEIESRVKKLREQIERRKKAKDEIVGLRLKTIVNETEGLGFPGPQDFGPAAIYTKKRAPGPAPIPGPVAVPRPDGRFQVRPDTVPPN